MDSLFSKVRGSSSQGSSTGRRSALPVREDRYILEEYESNDRKRHRSLKTDVILKGNKFQESRTSMTRTCNNLISRHQFMLQALENAENTAKALRVQLTYAGIALRDSGVLYDIGFPQNLKDWIEKNVGRTQEDWVGEDDLDSDMLTALIGQLIMIKSIKDERD